MPVVEDPGQAIPAEFIIDGLAELDGRGMCDQGVDACIDQASAMLRQTDMTKIRRARFTRSRSFPKTVPMISG